MRRSFAVVLFSVAACSDPGGGGGASDASRDVEKPDGPGDATATDTDAAVDAGPSDGDAVANDGAETVAAACTPNERSCDDNTAVLCRPDGSGLEVIGACPDDQVCSAGECRACVASQRRCTAAGAIETCAADGRWESAEDCASEGLSCVAGTCRSPCERDPKSNDNTGCDYWAIDMDNYPLAQDAPYAVIVSNLSALPAHVTVTLKESANTPPSVVLERDVAQGQLQILQLPNRNMGGSGVFWSSYRVQSNVPIVAYQFNPLANVDVFSNDATLLIPSNTFGKEYFVVSRFELEGVGVTPGTRIPYRGELDVVAAAEHSVVTVTPTCATQAGFGVPAMEKGKPYTFTLEPYQVLNVKSEQNGGDLTGTLVTSDKAVAVFGGHEAALTGNLCCADHLEHQMYPVATWGTSYIATKSRARQAESDYWRVIASVDDTTVTFTPAVSPPRKLARGEWFELATTRDFVVSADHPVSLAQTLASSYEVVVPPPYADCTTTHVCATAYTCEHIDQAGDELACFPPTCTPGVYSCPTGHTCTDFGGGRAVCTPVGDPTLIMVPPTKQFRDEYVFLAPTNYAEDYINVIAPAGAFVMLDGTLVASDKFVAVADGAWKVARLPVDDGVHRVVGDLPVGVIAYGWDRDVSYGYAAGLNLVVDE